MPNKRVCFFENSVVIATLDLGAKQYFYVRDCGELLARTEQYRAIECFYDKCTDVRVHGAISNIRNLSKLWSCMVLSLNIGRFIQRQWNN